MASYASRRQGMVERFANVCCMPSVVMYVLSSQTRGSKSLGSATDANVNMYRNPKDSVVCGMKEYAHGTQMKPPIPTFSSIPSCENFGNRQLVCASCVPKLKLSSPRARIVFSQGQVAALPRARFPLP